MSEHSPVDFSLYYNISEERAGQLEARHRLVVEEGENLLKQTGLDCQCEEEGRLEEKLTGKFSMRNFTRNLVRIIMILLFPSRPSFKHSS